MVVDGCGGGSGMSLPAAEDAGGEEEGEERGTGLGDAGETEADLWGQSPHCHKSGETW
jgi:hypothetical protein